MAGNVSEWCSSVFEGYPDTDDGSDLEQRGFRISRGGSSAELQFFCRSAWRLYYDADYGNSISGFRIVKNAD